MGVCAERLLLKSLFALTLETSMSWFPWISSKEIIAGWGFGDQSCHESTLELLPMELGGAGEGWEVADILFWCCMRAARLSLGSPSLEKAVVALSSLSVFEISPALRMWFDRRPPECPSHLNYSMNMVGNSSSCSCLGMSCRFSGGHSPDTSAGAVQCSGSP